MPSIKHAFNHAATAFATVSILYASEHHVTSIKRQPRRYRRRYELEVAKGYADWFINNMQIGDGIRFQGFFRMSSMEFEYLLQLVAPTIVRQDNNFQKGSTHVVFNWDK